ncbi:DUF2809 domain-containing protein [Mumia sp. ZJ1417]|uniref:ribosomal maturation YjgA family protein n=1 Tax=Mumia sp. ZJ1417 TaxID=2708082 RepID=UPI001423622D|nr:DUF2809 domain-containing protein [Mumia sp. ZJ1417]QMW65983.1 DUF2809 domain-containing protein [Mumia sp. ZJ1417]
MSPRTAMSVAIFGVVAAGLAARAVLPAPIAGPAGDALYATLVVLLVVAVRPTTPPPVAALVGFAVCVAVELFQLTGIPVAVAEHVPAARLVLGTTFWAPDLLRYAVGAAVGGVLCSVVGQLRTR